MRPSHILALAAGVVIGAPMAHAQGAPAATYAAPEVGTAAPDFSLSGADRYGLLRDPIKLSDFRGKTVVLAFFYRARTKG